MEQPVVYVNQCLGSAAANSVLPSSGSGTNPFPPHRVTKLSDIICVTKLYSGCSKVGMLVSCLSPSKVLVNAVELLIEARIRLPSISV